jgi:hypothetical protein
LIILEFHNHVFIAIIHFLFVQTHHTITGAMQCSSKQHRHLPVMLYYTQNNKCEGNAICHDGIWCSRGITPLIPQFGTKRESVVSFKTHLLSLPPRGNPRVGPEKEAGQALHMVWIFFRR